MVSVLQWGHDKIVMEVVRIELVRAAISYSLQWGHDKIVMEVLPDRDPKVILGYSFNGAMTK